MAQRTGSLEIRKFFLLYDNKSKTSQFVGFNKSSLGGRLNCFRGLDQKIGCKIIDHCFHLKKLEIEKLIKYKICIKAEINEMEMREQKNQSYKLGLQKFNNIGKPQ